MDPGKFLAEKQAEGDKIILQLDANKVSTDNEWRDFLAHFSQFGQFTWYNCH
jgi:hypothetical protein